MPVYTLKQLVCLYYTYVFKHSFFFIADPEEIVRYAYARESM